MSYRQPGERDEILDRLRKTLARPRSMAELEHKFDVDPRTVYRYLDDLAASGANVARVGLGRPTKYQII